MLGRAKSCQWQVFVRRRPPKQGELRTDVSKATMFQGDRKVSKGFNFVRGKVLFGCADSRFAEPRCSLQRERVYSFRLYEKNQKYPRGLRTSGLQGAIQISARYEISAEVTGQHHVTGCVGHDNLPGYRR